MSESPMQPTKVPGDNQSPDPRVVENFHRRSDVDSRKEAQHHTIGTGVNQAAAGSHRHDGSDSPLILEGFTITGSRGSATAMLPIIQALVRLGATDSTSA